METNKRYDVRFCSCGRIHIMPFDELDWLSEDHKNRRIIRICANCGKAIVTFLTENFDNGFDVNCCDLDDHKVEVWNNTKIYYSRGIIVYMKSRNEADSFQANCFANCKEWEQMMNSSPNGLCPIYEAEKQRQDWATVDTERLINNIKWSYKDDADNILKSISGYGVRIHWKGTEYETEWNK